MAQLKDIQEIERNKMEKGPFEAIYLFSEGTFYRAYEWSSSSLVMLNLDCSQSLGNQKFRLLKDYAKDFVDVLLPN